VDKRVLEMCREIDKQKLATAQDGVTAWAKKLLDENAALRGQLQKETQRRFDGNEIASKEHREEVAALREQLAGITEDRLESHRRWDAENAARMKAEAERDKVVAAFAHLKSFVSGDLQEYDAAEVASLINAALKEEGK